LTRILSPAKIYLIQEFVYGFIERCGVPVKIILEIPILYIYNGAVFKYCICRFLSVGAT